MQPALPGTRRGRSAPRPAPRVTLTRYLIATPRAWSTGSIGLANEAPLPPAKHSPTGLFPVSVTMSDPESPERMKLPGVWIWFTNVATPSVYWTRMVTLIAWTGARVRPEVRPVFLTASPTAAATVVED